MFLLVSFVICLLGVSLPETEAASCHMREVDLCFATMLLSATEGVPGNDEEVDKVCEPVQEGIECMGNYSVSCFTPLMQEVYDMVMAEPKKYQSLMCTHGTDERAKHPQKMSFEVQIRGIIKCTGCEKNLKEVYIEKYARKNGTGYLKNAPCFQKTLSGDNIRPHMEDLMVSLEAATEAKFQQRIPIMCCGIQRMFKATTSMVEAECGKEVLDEGGVMIGMSFTSLSDVFCRGYEPDSPKCSGILPPSGTPSRGSESKLQLIQFLNTAMSNLQ